MLEPFHKRFTLDGSQALEKRIGSLCDAVRDGILSIIPERRLEALVLGGGYGRGQGGVLRSSTGEEPYNDLEFYVFVKGNRLLNARRFQKAVNALGERLSPDAGLHIEFKVDSLERLRRSPVSMFSYDLVSGHRVIAGQQDVFKDLAHHADPTSIPISEATRLLFNRCSGLLLAKELFAAGSLGPEQLDFINRNTAKCELAMGDAVLCVEGLYWWDVEVRHRRLRGLETNRLGITADDWAAIKDHHSTGKEFKLHPHRTDLDALALRRKHDEVTALSLRIWLAIESSRLHQQFASAKEYSSDSVVKWDASPSWMNYILNLRSFGIRAAMDNSASRYPRERLLNALPILLWEESHSTKEVQSLFHARGADWRTLVGAYKEVWPSYG